MYLRAFFKDKQLLKKEQNMKPVQFYTDFIFHTFSAYVTTK